MARGGGGGGHGGGYGGSHGSYGGSSRVTSNSGHDFGSSSISNNGRGENHGQEGQHQINQGNVNAAKINQGTVNVAQINQGTVNAAHVNQYSQYYSMPTGAAQAIPVSYPETFNLAANTPTNVYVNNQEQPIPYAQYTSNPSYQGSNSLWIGGQTTSWAQYAQVPQGSNVQLVAVMPSQGNGYFSITDSNGANYRYNYPFYPNSHMNFYASSIGQHTISYTVNGITSNPVTLDVIGNTAPQSNYPGPQNTNPSNYAVL